jgi:Bacterial protein of unknown function (DUF899)
MVKMPEYTLAGEECPVRLADVFGGMSQLIVHSHMWFEGEDWQCPGCTGFTAEFTRLEFLETYDARFVVVTQGPIDETLAYKRKAGNTMTWYSTANSPFGAEVGARPGGEYAVNVFLRDGDTVYRTWHPTAGAPSGSPTPSASSTCSPMAGARTGKTPPTAGRSSPPATAGPPPRPSPPSTAHKPDHRLPRDPPTTARDTRRGDGVGVQRGVRH